MVPLTQAQSGDTTACAAPVADITVWRHTTIASWLTSQTPAQRVTLARNQHMLLAYHPSSGEP
jgi:hypothetical protein